MSSDGRWDGSLGLDEALSVTSLGGRDLRLVVEAVVVAATAMAVAAALDDDMGDKGRG